MKWDLTEPKLGDMIRAKVGPLYHYGIYVNDDEVIQFGLNPLLRQGTPEAQIEVCITSIEQFLCGEFIEVAIPVGKEKSKLNKPKTIVSLAKQRLGEKGYHLLYNNCEHFAYECFTGVKYSSQTENVRNMFRNMAIVDFYTAPIPADDINAVYPDQRQQQIDNTGNLDLKRQRYYVWKLLEYALKRSFGYKISDISFSKTENGKWICKECYFSLSHSYNAVAVAVSRKPIGIDIEVLKEPVNDKICCKILTDKEFKEYNNISSNEKSEFILKKWCAKESIFKSGTETVFAPKLTETNSDVQTGTFDIDGNTYCYAVASQDLDKLRIYDNIKL